MELTIQVNPVERTVRFREVHALAAGDSCAVVLEGVRGANAQALHLALYRDAASESPVASCPSFSPVQGHPNLATGTLRLDTAEMAAWFEAVRPESVQEGSSSSQARSRPEDVAERAVRTDGWLVVSEPARTWAACRVPVILRPGAGTSGVVDPTSLSSLVEGLVSAAMSGVLSGKADKVSPAAAGNLASLGADGNLVDSGASPSDFAPASHASDGSIHHTASEIGQIAAGEVAKIVANAPADLDTLKEIADVIGTESGQEAGGILKRVADLEDGKADKSEMSIAPVAGSPDRKTIQLKDGTSATVLTEHQDISDKVDKVPGKGLSENDYTDADKAKLAGLSPQTQADWNQTNAAAPDFIKNRPTIPALVAVDAMLATQGAAADAKAVGDALRSGFTEWEFSGLPAGVSVEHIFYAEPSWSVFLSDGSGGFWELPQTALLLDGAKSQMAYGTEGLPSGFTAVRHLITPTKTSQLTNDSGFLTQHQDVSGKLDGAAAYPAWEANPSPAYVAGTVVSYSGRLYRLDNLGLYGPDSPPDLDVEAWTEVLLKDLKQNALSQSQLAAVNSGATAAKVATWDGYAAQIAAKADASDVNAALAQKASFADLPYAMVTPGEWNGNSIYGKPEWYPPYGWVLEPTGSFYTPISDGLNPDAMQLEFDIGGPSVSVFTRASLPGHLLDRANNLVTVTANTTLTLPPFVAGKVRDLLVRLAFGTIAEGASVPTVIFQGQGDEAPDETDAISFVTDDGEFPVPDSGGDWWYSLTECAPHVFAVSLKQLQSMSQQTQTQGGS